MTTATAERQYLFHVISEQEPDLLPKRHINIEVGEEHAYAGTPLFPECRGDRRGS